MDLTFDDASYSEFLNAKEAVRNSHPRDGGETFFDAILSKEADLRTAPEGQKIIRFIQAIGNE